LWRLRCGSIATLSVRTVGTWTCPMDGWLTVSAGTRAALPRVPCGQLPAGPVRSGGAWNQDLVPVAKKTNMASNFRAAVGSLGDEVHQAGGCTAAVGPGASLVAADSGGRLDAYGPTPQTFTDWSRCRVTVVDLENVVRPYLGPGVSPHRVAVVSAAARAAAVRQSDDEIGRVLAAIPQHANVIVAGLSDQSDVPHLRVAIGNGPAFARGHYLRSASTRRDGMTILPDVTATVLSAAGLQVPSQVVGIPWAGGGSQGALADAARRLDGLDVAAQTLRTSIQPFFIVFVVCQLLVYTIGALALRGTQDTAGQKRRWRRRVLGVARILALVGAAIPVSTYLVNLLPWWKASQPAAAMFAGLLVWDLMLVAIALGGPWRRSVMIPGTIVVGVTALVAAADLLRGSPLQLNSFMGYSPLVGGRYYGLSNIAFATFATGTLFLAAGLAHVLIGRGRRGWAVAVVIALGASADALSGSPGLGAKFGGTIALFPGTAVTALIVAGKR
jgi:Arylsulfatase A and related enzymes